MAAALSRDTGPGPGAGDQRWREILRKTDRRGVLRRPDHRIEYVDGGPERLFGRREPRRGGLRELDPTLARQGLFAACEHVYASGLRYAADESPVLIDPSGSGRPQEAFFNVICSPCATPPAPSTACSGSGST